jgi:hypothetical protein
VIRNYTLHVKSHSTCGNPTLCVEIKLVRVKNTLMRIEITFVLVEMTLCVEIILVSVIFIRIRVKLTVVCVETTLDV